MGKNSNNLIDDMYVGDYDFEEDSEPITVNKGLKDLKQLQQKTEKLTKKQERAAKAASKTQEKSQDNWEAITDKPIPCKCNKCGTPVSGKMIAYFFQPFTDVSFPFVEYSCRQCYHVGRRSVYEAAMQADKFEKYYFG